jgi:hypothetical protein
VAIASTALVVSIGVPGVATAFQFEPPPVSALLWTIASAASLVLGCGWMLHYRQILDTRKRAAAFTKR